MNAAACQHCAAATRGPYYVFRKGCKGCEAREIARGPVFFHRNASDEKAREYRELLIAAQISPASVMRAWQAERERATA